MCDAIGIMKSLNPNAHVLDDGGDVGFREDVKDPDGRMYQIGYLASRDGRRALAFCLYNPWDSSRPNAGEEYMRAHVDKDGFICLGNNSVRDLNRSPYSLEYTIRRARYWCTAFSVFKETRSFPHP